MNTAIFQDVAMQSVETLRRAAERSVRGLRRLGQGRAGGQDQREALRQLLADSQADLASLGELRKTADELLREGMEAEAFLRFCELALEAAELTIKGSAVAEDSEPDISCTDPESGKLLLVQIKESSEQAHGIHAHFRRLAAWLQIPPSPLPQTVLEKLESLPPVRDPDGGARGDGQE